MADLFRSPIWHDPRVKPAFGAAQINWGHALAGPRLTGYWLFHMGGLRNLAGRSGLATQSDSVWGPSPLGSMLVHDNTSDTTTLASDSSLLLPTQEITIALEYRKLDTVNRASGAIGVSGDGASGPRCGVHLPYSDGVVYWDFGGQTENTTRESVSGLTVTGPHIWIFTSGPRGMEIWQDGILRSSNTANPTRTSDSARSCQLGVHGGIGGDAAGYGWVYINQRQLTLDQCRHLSLEPFAFLQPIIRRRYVVPEAAAGAEGGGPRTFFAAPVGFP